MDKIIVLELTPEPCYCVRGNNGDKTDGKNH